MNEELGIILSDSCILDSDVGKERCGGVYYEIINGLKVDIL